MTNGSGRNAAAVAAAIFALHLSIIPRTTLFDRDEPRFAQAAVEMAGGGTWLYPTVAGEVRAQKPILIYWLMAAAVRLLGPGEVAARLPSAVAIAGAALGTWFIGRRLLSERAALIAMVVLALNPLVMIEGSAATADGVLLALVTAGVAAFVARLTTAAGAVPALAFAIATAGALLAKGPAGLVAPAMAAIVLWRLRARPDTPRIAVEFSAATLGSLGIFMWWFAAADAATGGAFLRDGIGREVLDRLVTPLEGHGGASLPWLLVYPAAILIGFAPWSPLLVPAWRDLRDGRHDDPLPHRVLTTWVVLPLAIFSLAATRLPHYALPVWPALALICARLVSTPQTVPSRLLRGWTIGGAALAMIVAAAITVSPRLLGLPSLWLPSLALALALAASAAAAMRRPGDVRAAATAGAAGMLAFELLAGWWWLPAADAVKPVPCIAARVRPLAATSDLAAYGFDAPSVIFYLGRRPQQLAGVDEAAHWMANNRPGLLLTTRELASALPGAFTERAACRGFDISHGTRLELVALERRARDEH